MQKYLFTLIAPLFLIPSIVLASSDGISSALSTGSTSSITSGISSSSKGSAQSFTYSDSALNFMVAELEKLVNKYKIINMDQKTEKNENLDDYQNIKYALLQLIHSLYDNTKQIRELRKVSTEENGRDIAIIKKMSANDKMLKGCVNIFHQLKQQIIKDEESKRFSEKIINSRKIDTINLGTEINRYMEINKRAQVQVVVASMKSPDELNARAAARAARREQRKHDRAAHSGVEMVEPEHMQQFKQEVMENDQKFGDQLDQINAGLSALKHVGDDIRIPIDVTTHQAENLTHKTQDLNKKMKTSNKRMKELLEESGGCSRWCTAITLVIVLWSLITYMMHALALA